MKASRLVWLGKGGEGGSWLVVLVGFFLRWPFFAASFGFFPMRPLVFFAMEHSPGRGRFEGLVLPRQVREIYEQITGKAGEGVKEGLANCFFFLVSGSFKVFLGFS